MEKALRSAIEAARATLSIILAKALECLEWPFWLNLTSAFTPGLSEILPPSIFSCVEIVSQMKPYVC